MYGGCHCSSRPRCEQRVAELDRLDEPLAARDDLERAVALLVELHGVRDRPRLADQIAGLSQLLDDLRRAPWRPTDRVSCVVVALRARARRPTPSPALPHVHRPQRAVGLNDRRAPAGSARATSVTSVMSPNVQIIGDAAALRGIGQRVRLHRHAHAEERRRHLVPNSGWYRSSSGCATERHAGGNQLGPRRLDLDDRGRRPGLAAEARCDGRRPACSRSSSSACATAVLKSTSHSVGAST